VQGNRLLPIQRDRLTAEGIHASSVPTPARAQNAPLHQKMSLGSEMMRDIREVRAIALYNLPLWMALINVYRRGFGVNCFLGIFAVSAGPVMSPHQTFISH
jgi:hypothetical protein